MFDNIMLAVAILFYSIGIFLVGFAFGKYVLYPIMFN
jgi:hypothetical protein